jgi:hypothetical protein
MKTTATLLSAGLASHTTAAAIGARQTVERAL